APKPAAEPEVAPEPTPEPEVAETPAKPVEEKPAETPEPAMAEAGAGDAPAAPEAPRRRAWWSRALGGSGSCHKPDPARGFGRAPVTSPLGASPFRQSGQAFDDVAGRAGIGTPQGVAAARRIEIETRSHGHARLSQDPGTQLAAVVGHA